MVSTLSMFSISSQATFLPENYIFIQIFDIIVVQFLLFLKSLLFLQLILFWGLNLIYTLFYLVDQLCQIFVLYLFREIGFDCLSSLLISFFLIDFSSFVLSPPFLFLYVFYCFLFQFFELNSFFIFLSLSCFLINVFKVIHSPKRIFKFPLNFFLFFLIQGLLIIFSSQNYRIFFQTSFQFLFLIKLLNDERK